MIEIIQKDLLARIARFRTKTGIIETPTFIPVVHPTRVLIPPRRMYDEFSCKTIITNAYLLSKSEQQGKIHDILDFPGSIMTDSGAYQLLIYGDVQATPSQIIEFQEHIESDIAVILDIPTGGHATYKEAKETVTETLQRAKESISDRKKSNILWAGPIQGGTFLDLVAKSAQEISKLDFSVYAIGSPTQLMEQYQFDRLVDLVLTAKSNLPNDKPVHLFGAGHPLIFPLIVAMGCDMFDSAAYALFARHDRILSTEGTYRLNDIQEEFCNCPTCVKFTISEIKQLEKEHRFHVLAEHNLRICQREINQIKQAIREGRLWRLVESRLNYHPSLIDAMSKMVSYQKLFERYSPVTKKRAIFITSQWSLYQPEIIRHQSRIISYFAPKSKRNTLLLFSAPQARPYHTSHEFTSFQHYYHETIPDGKSWFDIIFLSPIFGLVPIELTNFFPLAQNEIPQTDFIANQLFLVNQLKEYVETHPKYEQYFGIFAQTNYWRIFVQNCQKMFKKLDKTSVLSYTDFTETSLKKILTVLPRE